MLFSSSSSKWHAAALEANNLHATGTPDTLNGNSYVSGCPHSVRLAIKIRVR